MNKGGVIHPRLFEHHAALWDRTIQLQAFTETFDPTNQSVKTYYPAPGLPEFLDARRGVFSAADLASRELRQADLTTSIDTEYIALPAYYPQIEKEWRATFGDGDYWDVLGVIFDSTRTQTYLLVERVES